jgi:hypothetical protein
MPVAQRCDVQDEACRTHKRLFLRCAARPTRRQNRLPSQNQRNSDQNDVLHRHSPDEAEELQITSRKRRLGDGKPPKPARLNPCHARLGAERRTNHLLGYRIALFASLLLTAACGDKPLRRPGSATLLVTAIPIGFLGISVYGAMQHQREASRRKTCQL